ncbi:FecR family protein [Runella limosa]|uniref:FecR family protein n=1 Tax=Runella limosa TaxID=370978 RepID=UPI0003FE9CAE|nr:FecR family protein [Runella limosa]
MQPRDLYTKVEDFLSDESFQRWVRFKENHTHWEEWTLESPERAKLVAEARVWVLSMKIEETELSAQEIQRSLQDTWEAIQTQQVQKPIWKMSWFRVAAAVLLVGTAAMTYFLVQKNPAQAVITYKDLVEKDTEGLIEQTNNSNKPQLITLADASSVLLQPKSKLSYPKEFSGNERKVYLSGEAFFEISKNPSKPFYVYANEVVTKVYGTSFRVIAYPSLPNVEVLVRTGKVKVMPNEEIEADTKEGIMLLPNQAARFVRNNLSFEKILDITQDKPLIASTNTIEQLSFEFRDIPVEQIFTTIEQAYLVKIEYPKEKLKDCYMTTSLSDEPLPEKLKIICESLGSDTRYEMNGNQVTIISSGCN